MSSAERSPRGFLAPIRALPVVRSVLAILRARRELRALPGQIDDIALYASLRSPAVAGGLDERTWRDLDMDAVFRRVDRASSGVGQQVLYDLLRHPARERAELAVRDAGVRRLAERPAARRAIAEALRSLRGRGTYQLPHLLLDPLPPRPPLHFLLPVLSLAALAALIAGFQAPRLFLLLLPIVAINIAVQGYYRPNVQHLLPPLAALRGLLAAGRRLGEVPLLAEEPAVRELATRCRALRWLGRLTSTLVHEAGGNEAADTLMAYANLLFLLDVNAFVFSIELIRRHREDLVAVFEQAGRLDAFCAVAELREDLPVWCVPGERPAPTEGALDATQLLAEGVYHPLLADAIPNDLRPAGRSLLITGSNMAGKTTYLRAVGVAAVLGQALATCPARAWRGPLVEVRTFIDRQDDLLEGRSYFMVEAEVMGELLAASVEPGPHLFILDELFRGTNTRERIAASAGVLEFMGRAGHLCLVATHDVELAELLGERWAAWHFREEVEEAGVRFDYAIRPGVSSAPNALRILARTGYPEAVLARAFEIYEAP